LNASQGTLNLGAVSVSSSAGAAQAQFYGQNGVAMNGNVGVSGQSALAGIGAGGAGTRISLASGMTALVRATTPGAGGAALSILNDGGSLRIDGRLSAQAPTGDSAAIFTDPVLALPGVSANSAAAAAATAASAGQSILASLLAETHNSPVGVPAAGAAIIVPTWIIVTPNVRSSGSNGGALLEDDGQGVIGPTTDNSVDDLPINTALLQ
jgi:hypothetical protein